MGSTDWAQLGPLLQESLLQTLLMVGVTVLVGGALGLALGVLLVTTRPGGILAHRGLHTVLNVIVNIVRPIPFIIFITAVGPLTLQVMGTTVGTRAVLFPLALAATFGISRIVEQNLVAVDPGVIEAAQAMGASPWRIIRTVLVPEALGPLVLGYTFALVAVVDMTAIAGAIGGGGLGQFAITYGYQRFNWVVTGVAVVVIIVLVQLAQFSGNALSRKVMRR
ncbi:D-methionine transport system permease protein [Barrientosiimonas humi]|uniref:D-methionine transport system permease protein n=2 Tax=Barrientosiimonas TaxID=1535207 RepID=A0A542X8I1_9MICO|nr:MULTISPECIES: methionine ABC transporter permease [Barrientosiimonas]TQL32142.1 D-methionine transport system permease protein [Barrientosiimonas humi]BDZ56880.1 putative ABC-type transporter, permease component [Barrientosiimonas endolithica]CAG7572130.1 D-methionine transport system permease protein MetI [Barrientosiimonas humi]